MAISRLYIHTTPKKARQQPHHIAWIAGKAAINALHQMVLKLSSIKRISSFSEVKLTKTKVQIGRIIFEIVILSVTFLFFMYLTNKGITNLQVH